MALEFIFCSIYLFFSWKEQQHINIFNPQHKSTYLHPPPYIDCILLFSLLRLLSQYPWVFVVSFTKWRHVFTKKKFPFINSHDVVFSLYCNILWNCLVLYGLFPHCFIWYIPFRSKQNFWALLIKQRSITTEEASMGTIDVTFLHKAPSILIWGHCLLLLSAFLIYLSNWNKLPQTVWGIERPNRTTKKSTKKRKFNFSQNKM